MGKNCIPSCGHSTNITPNDQKEQEQEDSKLFYQIEKNTEDITLSEFSEDSVKTNQKEKQKQRKCFARLTEKYFSDDDLLDADIIKLNFGVYPYDPKNDPPIEFSFKPFIYVECFDKNKNYLLEAGSFSKEEANQNVSAKAHNWGKDDMPGVEMMEKIDKTFAREFKHLLHPVQDINNYGEYFEFLICFLVNKDKTLKVRKILESIDPNKDRYLLSDILEGKTNCFKFCVDVIKYVKENNYIIIDNISVTEYFDRVKEIMTRLKKQIPNCNDQLKQIEDFCSLLGIKKKFAS